MSGRLVASGLGIELPRGWDGAITPGEGQTPGTHQPRLHASNIALPPERGDFGGGAVERLGARGVFISLVEYDREAAATALFSRDGIPRTLDQAWFSTATMQRLIPGQAGYQSFASEQGRAFCLYVVVGSYALRTILASAATQVLGTLVVDRL